MTSEVGPVYFLLVDDLEENISAAREVGMLAVQYQGHAEFTAAMCAAGLEYLLHPESVS